MVKDSQDVSNFDKGKVYEEKEKIDPFYQKEGGSPRNTKIIEAKQILHRDTIFLNRFDILDAGNRKNAEELEETKFFFN